jgi:hypothetical protein
MRLRDLAVERDAVDEWIRISENDLFAEVRYLRSVKSVARSAAPMGHVDLEHQESQTRQIGRAGARVYV